MVAAESTFEIPAHEELNLVTQIKYDLDPERRWWQKAWLRLLFLPFVRFSFRRVGIGLPKAIRPDGTIELYEIQGLLSDEQDAERVCQEQGEFWSHRRIAVDLLLPRESVQYSRRHYPNSILPDRYRRPTIIPGVAIGTHRQVAELTETLNTISRTATGRQ